MLTTFSSHYKNKVSSMQLFVEVSKKFKTSTIIIRATILLADAAFFIIQLINPLFK